MIFWTLAGALFAAASSWFYFIDSKNKQCLGFVELFKH